MEDSSIVRLTLRGLPGCIAVGLLVGGLEALPLALAVKVDVGLGALAALILLSAAGFAALGAIVGLPLGLLSHAALRRFVVERGLGAQVALTGGLLIFVLFSGFAEEAFADGRAAAALFLLGLPLLLMATGFLLVSRLYRPGEGAVSAPLVLSGVGLGGLVLLLLAGLGLRAGQGPSASGLPSDPRVLVVMVDSLRADLGAAPTPNLDRLSARSASFSSAIVPQPESGPSLATLQTGLHPLRHEVIAPGDRLRRVEALLSATFEAEGFATGGFVSSAELDHRYGFDFGFQVYDDDRIGGLPALGRVRLVDLALRLTGLAPADRPDAATVDRFLAWLDRASDLPFFAVVHLHGPRAPYRSHGLPGFEASGPQGAGLVDHRARLGDTDFDEVERRALRRLYREEIAAVDLQLGRILDAIDAHELTSRTLVVVVGTGGEVLGEHGGAFTHRGLFDATVRVPLILAVPGLDSAQVFPYDVRLQDLYPTLLAHAELRPRHESEGLSLGGFLTGRRDKSLPNALVGRDLDGAWAVGLRSGGAKFVVRLIDGVERLFDLDEDPRETQDAAETMPATVDQARRIVHPDRVRLTELVRSR